KTKPDTLQVKEFKRPHQAPLDPERCFLDQGFLCLGPVTRCGCDSACINGNMPCSGCLGPLDGIRDYGAKALSAFASILDFAEEQDIENALDAIADPGGTFYRYSLPASLMHRRLTRGDGESQ
ncbi:MAG TPA: oxidoreductase, partial [bacterium]|nr:oxidoreductase [bacterium]